jgi:hypothetical protein
VTDTLRQHLATLPPGPITDTGTLARLLADAWDKFSGDDGGIIPGKHLNRMEGVAWAPPSLSFTIERHGGTVLGSTRATLQEWTLDLEKKTARCAEARSRQLSPTRARLDVRPLVEEVARLIVSRQEDDRLRWGADGRVRVLLGKVLPEGSAVRQTLAGRRKRLRAALTERLGREGWRPTGHWYVYSPGPVKPPPPPG